VSDPAGRQTETPPRRRTLAAMIALSLVAAVGLAIRRAGTTYAGEVIPVDRAGVDAASEKVDPNTATVASLRRLPGIGPVKARAIVAFREGETRPYRNADDLCRVYGIGPGTVRRIAPFLSIPAEGN